MKTTLRGLLAAGLFLCAAVANAALLNIDVGGIDSNAPEGDSLNEVRTFNIGTNAHVTGIGWDVTLVADSPSWLSEMAVSISNSSDSAGVTIIPGVVDDLPGVKSYSSAGIVAVDFNVLADGILRLEFFEAFDDFAGDWDGFWQSGVISVQYDAAQIPEPGTLVLLGLGLAGLAASRRRKH